MPLENWFGFRRKEDSPPPALSVREYHNAGDKTVAAIAEDVAARGERLAGVKEAQWIKRHAHDSNVRSYVERYKDGHQYFFFGGPGSCYLQWDGKAFKLWSFHGIMSPNLSPWDLEKQKPGSPRRHYVVRM